jgi:hypothetical protein
MKSIFNGEGYLLNDNRASGGLRKEDGVLGCVHGQCLIEKSLWRFGKSGAYCPQCDGPICTYHAIRMQQFGCEPFAKAFTAAIEDQYRKEQNAKIMGVERK